MLVMMPPSMPLPHEPLAAAGSHSHSSHVLAYSTRIELAMRWRASRLQTGGGAYASSALRVPSTSHVTGVCGQMENQIGLPVAFRASPRARQCAYCSAGS